MSIAEHAPITAKMLLAISDNGTGAVCYWFK
jgi:hypothetical protein